MATTYKWVVSSLDSYPKDAEGLTDVICVIHWRYQAEQVENEKTYFAEVYGTLSVPSPDPANFVPYEDVTYEMVCSWLEAGLDKEALEQNLDSQIEDQINPKIVTLPLPFSNPQLSLQIKNNENEVQTITTISAEH
jgi:hypothetical protein